MPLPREDVADLADPVDRDAALDAAVESVGPGGGTEKSRRFGARTNAPGSPVERPGDHPPDVVRRRSAGAARCGTTRTALGSGTTSVCVAIWNTESPLV